MRVLVTNAALENWAGSELYARDLARALRRRGHTVSFFSPFLGEMAEELRREGFAVVDDLLALPAAPDLIHGQHHAGAMAALAFFPESPVVYFCHGTLPWDELPPRHPRIRRYVAVSESVAEHLTRHAGIAETEIEILRNFVDLERFPPRPPLPRHPRRSLVFGNYVGESPVLAALREACGEHGVSVDAVGAAAGRPVRDPETVLGAYDLVFAIGRSALEAMATGTAVVLCNTEGLGEMVTPGNFERLRRGNFGRATLTRPASAAILAHELRRFDPGEVAAVAARVRREMALEVAADRVVELYERVLAEPPAPWSRAAERDALHAYHRWLARSIRGRLLDPLRLAEERLAAASSRAEIAEKLAGELAAALAAARQREAGSAERLEAAAASIARAEAVERRSRQLATDLTEALRREAEIAERLESTEAASAAAVAAANARTEAAERRHREVADWAHGIETSLTWRLARAFRALPGVLPAAQFVRRVFPGWWRAPQPVEPIPPNPGASAEAPDGPPELACVVLAHGEAPWIAEAVASLASQDTPCEIVVVHTGGENPEERLHAAGLAVPVVHRYRLLLPGAARNLGIAATAAPYVAFLAADCRAEPGWVRGRLQRHRAGAPLVASAMVNATPSSAAALAAHLALFARRLPGTPADQALLYGVSYARELLAAVGPFREDLRAGEDTEHLERAAPRARPLWVPEVRTAHRHPASVAGLLRDQRARGARAARAWSRLGGRAEHRRVALNALLRWLPSLWAGVRAGRGAGWRLAPAAALTPFAAAAYAWGAWRCGRGPDPESPPVYRVFALCAFRDEARFLPGLLENLSGTVDGLLALDDGSTDGSAELVAAHPLTVRLLRGERPPGGTWDEPGNQRRLIEAAWETDADWLIAVDADERLESGFRERAQEAIARARAKGYRAYWVHIRELWDQPDTYRVDGVWGRKGHLRFFVNSRQHQFDTAELHRHWGPVDARVDGQFVPCDINVYHLRMLREADRQARRDRYLRLDPDRRWQSIGYEYLTETAGLELEPLPEGRGYSPLGEGDLPPLAAPEQPGPAALAPAGSA